MTAEVPAYRRLAGHGRFVRLQGIDVHYRTAGQDGPAVVLFHHHFGNLRTWRHVVDGLADVARVVAFDRPGFGFTERPRGRRRAHLYTRETATRLATGLMDHLDMGAAVLVGSSAGATTALETVHRAPQRVHGLVLLAPAITGDVGPPAWSRPLLRHAGGLLAPLIRRRADDITPARVGRGWFDPSRLTEEDVAAYLAPLEVPGWEAALWAAMTADAPPDLRHVLPRIRVPTLVVSGTHDRTVRPAWSRRVAVAVPGGRYVELPEVGHTPHEEAPERLLPVLRRFLADLG